VTNSFGFLTMTIQYMIECMGSRFANIDHPGLFVHWSW